MQKFSLLIGERNGKAEVLAGPSSDVNEHIQQLKDLTDRAGRVSEGKNSKQYDSAVVIHSTKGVMKKRSFA